MIQTPSRDTKIADLISKGYFWSIAFFCICLPIKPNFLQNLQAYALIFFLLMSLFKIIINKEYSLKGTSSDLLMFCSLFIWLAIGLLYSEDIGQGTKYLETKLGLILIPGFMIIVNPLSKEEFQKVLKIYLMAVCFFMLMAFTTVIIHNYQYNQLNQIVWIFYFYHSLVHFIGMHAVYMSIQVSLALLIAFHFFFLPGKSIRYQLLLSISILFLGLSLIFLTVKMIIVAFVFALLIYVLMRFKSKKAFFISSILLLVLVGAISTLSFSSRFSNRVSFVKDNLNYQYDKSPENADGYWGSINLRLALAKNAIEVISSNLVFGTGIGDEKAERLKQYHLNSFYFATSKEFNEHNQYLNIFLCSGIVGLIILLTLLFLPFLKAIQSRDLLYLAFIVLIVFSFLSENYLSRLQGVSFFAFFHSLFWVQYRLENKTI